MVDIPAAVAAKLRRLCERLAKTSQYTPTTAERLELHGMAVLLDAPAKPCRCTGSCPICGEGMQPR